MDQITMKTQLDIDTLLKTGSIKDELDYERALIFDRKLRILEKNNPKIKRKRKKLRDLIEEYAHANWSSSSQISNKISARFSDVPANRTCQN
jgi:hypothetical protein